MYGHAGRLFGEEYKGSWETREHSHCMRKTRRSVKGIEIDFKSIVSLGLQGACCSSV